MEDPPLLSEMWKPTAYCWIKYLCTLAAKRGGGGIIIRASEQSFKTYEQIQK